MCRHLTPRKGRATEGIAARGRRDIWGLLKDSHLQATRERLAHGMSGFSACERNDS